MRVWSSAVFLGPIALASVLLACSSLGEGAASGSSDLIGGRPASTDDYPATLLIEDNCTATKVGPRHVLTAAHCVTGQQANAFVPGAKIGLTAQRGMGGFASDAGTDGGSVFRSYVVESTELEPTWAKTCTGDLACGKSYVSCRTAVGDVALVIVTEPIAGVPEAAVDLSPVDVGDPVALTGYGCESGVGANWNYANKRLKIADTRSIAFENTIHHGSTIYEEDRDSGLPATMSGIYSITPGPNFADGGIDAGEAGGLCPGDSGGPLYRRDGTGLTVVGVNSSYTFSTGWPFRVDDEHTVLFGGSPVTNWHTRLDDTRGLKVGAWLQSLGVKVVCSRGGCPGTNRPE